MRIIPRLDVKSEYLIDTINFEGLRKIGDPKLFAVEYFHAGADEIIFYDLVASLYGRNSLNNFVQKLSDDVFIPITVCGGIGTINDAHTLFRSGADKIGINTAAVKNPKLISEISNIYGSQSVLVSIEVRTISGARRVLIDGGRELSDKIYIDWLKEVQDLGAGEIHLLSIDREGTSRGLDLDLLSAASEVVEIPIIISGGFCSNEEIIQAYNLGASGVCIAGALHRKENSITDIKKYMALHGIEGRYA